MANATVQKEFKEFRTEYAKRLREVREARKDAVGILDPKKLREAYDKGLKDATQLLVLQYGRNGERHYSPADLARFLAARKRVKKNFGATAGVSLDKLEQNSLLEDIRRSRREIRNATLYQVNGSILHFRVTASEGSDRQYHRVRVRLEDWTLAMSSEAKSLPAAAAACQGRISFDCSCGRHQFWFRYIATMGGFALEPQEHGFPKIRNPRLRGCCCKHVLKVLNTLRGSTLHAVLAKEMERQATAPGFADKRGRMLSPEELKKTMAAKEAQQKGQEARQTRALLKKMEKVLADITGTEAAKELRKTLAPKGKRADLSQKTEKMLVPVLKDIAALSAVAKRPLELDLEACGRMYQVSVDVLKGIMKRHGISVQQSRGKQTPPLIPGLSAAQRHSLTRLIRSLLQQEKDAGLTPQSLVRTVAAQKKIPVETLMALANSREGR